ncbi:Oligopeptide transport ATP-binding protein OppF (TC 3.A.1.5.1) [hydrothermal vent metagenome]|uniref:Oligopeptide transport ATP-binding protein OppF (TC 3.A.1.5.1) n=1 Tax=hydrothermal vent metagenome TaxID=652676 RepID=A0A1W1EA33_9ZZZZ
MSILLNIHRLSIVAGGNYILDEVSFSIQSGEIMALVGESGSGKSIISLAIMRLLPQALMVAKGDVMLEGTSLFVLPEVQMRRIRGRRIAMIFQEPMSALNPVMRIGEQVAEAIRVHFDYPSSEVKKRVIALFEEVAIPDPQTRYDWYPHQLSGGQKQRVMIAMALACEPEVLIADEPTTALDVTVQAQVLSLLKEIRDKRGLSILFITHDLAVVSQIADTIAVMKDGKIVEQADANTLFASPSHPYTRQLLENAVAQKVSKEKEVSAEVLLNVETLKVYFPVKRGFFGQVRQVVKAVDGVSLTIERGKTLALVGESGSGKTTLGQAILSLVPVSGGSIWFGTDEITALPKKIRQVYRKKIQVIFQDPFAALDPRMNIGQIIKEGMESLGVGPRTPKEQHRYIEEILRKVELDSAYIDRYPHELSGGQRQRVGIARALAVDPELIICDEPTSALDVTVRAQILHLLKRLQQERGLSYLFITHDLSLVPDIAHDVAVMCSGKIVEQGRVDKVFTLPQHPYTQKLLLAVPKLPKALSNKKRKYDHTV